MTQGAAAGTHESGVCEEAGELRRILQWHFGRPSDDRLIVSCAKRLFVTELLLRVGFDTSLLHE